MNAANRITKSFVLFALLASCAHAESITSIYSDFDIAKCKIISKSEEDGGGTWKCKGIKGFDVIYSEGDLRGTVGFGKYADEQCSTHQSFGHFNSPSTKIEWRIENGKPFATIMRWFTDNGEPDGKQNWLVVTKLNGKDACRTALIDTKYPNANAVAQQKSDSTRNFNCEKDLPEVVASTMIKADEIVSGTPCSP
jgi:hypothetical protein